MRLGWIAAAKTSSSRISQTWSYRGRRVIDLLSALLIMVLLCSSAGLGMFIRPRLPPPHRARETVEMMTLVIGLLVTFASLVLGLVTASVKKEYDDTVHYRQEYALLLAQLDRCLRNYGPEADAARTYVRSYTAADIAIRWPSEPPPVGVHYPDTSGMHKYLTTGEVPLLTDLMNHAGQEINRFSPTDASQTRIAASCSQGYRDVVRARLSMAEAKHAAPSAPFDRILVFWLMIIFGSFGLVAPRHSLSVISIVLCAVSLSTAIFVIVALSRPYDGVFGVSSASMRTALDSMRDRDPEPAKQTFEMQQRGAGDAAPRMAETNDSSTH